MLKKNEKFLVASQDNAISIWRMKYNKNSVYPENFNIEKIICDSFGGISCVVSPIPDKDILVIGSIDGMIRIYDYQNKQMIAELPGYKNSVHEIAAISEKNNGKNEDKQFVIVSCCLDEKMLKYWIVNKKEGKNEYGIVSEKYEDYGIVSGLDRKNKIQLAGTIPTLLLLDEIKGQIVILETNLK